MHVNDQNNAACRNQVAVTRLQGSKEDSQQRMVLSSASPLCSSLSKRCFGFSTFSQQALEYV